MTQEEHFNRSVAVLVKAYFEGILVPLSCAACGAGNLIAAANGFAIVPFCIIRSRNQLWMWDKPNVEIQDRDPHAIWTGCSDMPNAEEYLARTGYTRKQMTEIEDAFMGWKIGEDATDHFICLMRTVDKLADIHGIDLASTQAAKELFVKA